jgi:membrane-associated protein
VPFVAGVAEMPYRRFVGFNILGGILWVVSLVLLGRLVGATPLGDQLHRVILVVVAISLIPLVVSAYKVWRKKREEIAG